MSTELLYHGFGIHGYEHVDSSFEGGEVTLVLRHKRASHRCSVCGGWSVVLHGEQSRRLRTVPLGGKPVWLEHQLVGLDLGSLVAELAIVHGAKTAPTTTLRDVWGSATLERVQQHGLKVLSEDQWRTLLRQPSRLLELQELILINGGEYWNKLLAGPGNDQAVKQGAERLAGWLNERTEAPPTVAPARPSTPVYRRPWIVSFATAAAILIGVYFMWPPPKDSQVQVAQAGWGWNRPDALPTHLAAPAYLNRLADEGDEWFAKRPEDAASLAKRLNEMRQGCSTLILATHQPLKNEDRQWLVEKCRAWAKNFDQQLADLEQGKDPALVRSEIDMTVNRLVKALRERANAA